MMRNGYADDPENHGIQVITDDYMNKMFDCAQEHGMQVSIHAIGDEAIESVVNMYEKGTKGTTPKALLNPNRNSIIPVSYTHLDVYKRQRPDRRYES